MNEQRGCESLFWSQGNLHEWKKQLVRKRQPNCTHQCTPSKTVSIPYEHSHSFIHSPTPKNLQKITCTSMAAMISVTNKQYLYPAHIPVDSALLGLQWHISCQDLGKLQFTRKKKKRKSPKHGSGSCGNRAKCEAHRGMRSPFATPQSFPTPLPFPSLVWFWGIISIHDHNHTSRPFIETIKKMATQLSQHRAGNFMERVSCHRHKSD